MKLKTLVTAVALTSVSGLALAQDYRFEVGADYSDTDYDGAAGSDDSFGAYGKYYFQPVRPTTKSPLAEMAFVNRSSNAYVIGESDLDVVTGGVEFYIPDTIFYVNGKIRRTDHDGEETNNDWGVDLGVTPIEGMLIWTEYFDEDGYDANIHAKYVMPMSGGNFLNIEGGYIDADEDNTAYVAADFYFDQTFSVGAGYADVAGDDQFSLRTRKFFTTEFSADLSYTKSDYADIIAIGASYRF